MRHMRSQDGAHNPWSAPTTEFWAPTGKETGPAQFYAHFQLDPVRGIKQLGDILDHIAAHLGPNLELALEVRAENADGYNDATRRTVSENAQNLNAQAAEFE